MSVSPKTKHTIRLPVSRRRFIKDALVSGGIFCAQKVFALGPFVKDLLLPCFSAADQRPPPRKAIGHVARVHIDESACASCGLCTLVCAAVHGGDASPSLAGIWLDRNPFECKYTSLVCLQCEHPECLYACETEGAFFIDQRTGARTIDPAKCIGCKQCIEACVFDTPRIGWDDDREVAVKCDLCSDSPEGPACVSICPRQALILTTEDEA